MGLMLIVWLYDCGGCHTPNLDLIDMMINIPTHWSPKYGFKKTKNHQKRRLCKLYPVCSRWYQRRSLEYRIEMTATSPRCPPTTHTSHNSPHNAVNYEPKMWKKRGPKKDKKRQKREIGKSSYEDSNLKLYGSIRRAMVPCLISAIGTSVGVVGMVGVLYGLKESGCVSVWGLKM